MCTERANFGLPLPDFDTWLAERHASECQLIFSLICQCLIMCASSPCPCLNECVLDTSYTHVRCETDFRLKLTLPSSGDCYPSYSMLLLLMLLRNMGDGDEISL